MRKNRMLLCGGVWLTLAAGLFSGGLCAAQQLRPAQPANPDLPPELRIVPDLTPMPSLEVVTVRKAEPNPPRNLLMTTMQAYILNAYSMSPPEEERLVGGPSWLASQPWVINGKPSDELRDAMKKMTPEQLTVENQMLRRSVLRDQFKLKTHVETRRMQYFDLVPAKGGLKIKEVPAFVPPTPGTPPPPFVPGVMRPGMIMVQFKDGKTVVNARAVTITTFIHLLSRAQEVEGRPVVDKTGFKGSFDLTDMQWAGVLGIMNGGAPPPQESVDAPSLYTALEETLGLKLVPAKGPVEVLVVDSIEEPTEN